MSEPAPATDADGAGAADAAASEPVAEPPANGDAVGAAAEEPAQKPAEEPDAPMPLPDPPAVPAAAEAAEPAEQQPAEQPPVEQATPQEPLASGDAAGGDGAAQPAQEAQQQQPPAGAQERPAKRKREDGISDQAQEIIDRHIADGSVRFLAQWRMSAHLRHAVTSERAAHVAAGCVPATGLWPSFAPRQCIAVDVGAAAACAATCAGTCACRIAIPLGPQAPSPAQAR